MTYIRPPIRHTAYAALPVATMDGYKRTAVLEQPVVYSNSLANRRTCLHLLILGSWVVVGHREGGWGGIIRSSYVLAFFLLPFILVRH